MPKKLSPGRRLLKRLEERMLYAMRHAPAGSQEFMVRLAFWVGAKDMYAVQRHLKK